MESRHTIKALVQFANREYKETRPKSIKVYRVKNETILSSDYSSSMHKSNLEPSVTFQDPRANYFAMNGDVMNTTNIIIDDIDVRPEIGCIIGSSYKIFDTHNEKKIYDIKSELIFNEKSDRCLIKYIVDKV